MPIPDPQLDDRRFQDLVNEAKEMIPRFCPEWTDHNVSDPGVTLIELFAWMVDLLLYRVNRVPEKMYLRFLDLLGIQLTEAIPARTRVTFTLSAPQPIAVTVAHGTEVSTVRTQSEEAISFTTEDDLVLYPPVLRSCLSSGDEVTFVEQRQRLESGEGFSAFRESPLPGDGVYFGFPENITAHLLVASIDASVAGIGIDPRNPPLAWEAWCGETAGWVRVTIDEDTTGGFNQVGTVTMLLPPDMESRALGGTSLYWVRFRVVQPRQGQAGYSSSPVIRGAEFRCLGGSTLARHTALVEGEILGRASGAPGETYSFSRKPLLERTENDHIEVLEGTDDATWVPWTEVTTFQNSGPDDRHYVIDGVSGTASFGPVIRRHNGLEVAHGMTPAKGHLIRIARYRYGGGTIGNVGEHTLIVLRSSLPYVAAVTNRRPATGGMDPESLDEAKLRAPAALRGQDRAVTASDYEFLAKQASRRVARVKCIPVRSERNSTVPPGTVEMLILPNLPDQLRTLEALQPPPDLIAEVRDYLDERRLLGTELVVDGPAYIGVRVETTLVTRRGVSGETVRAEVGTRIKRYLDPLHGGNRHDGWPFGRDLYASELQSIILSVPGVEYVRETNLIQIDVDTGQTRAAAQQMALAEDVLPYAYDPVVTVVVDR